MRATTAGIAAVVRALVLVVCANDVSTAAETARASVVLGTSVVVITLIVIVGGDAIAGSWIASRVRAFVPVVFADDREVGASVRRAHVVRAVVSVVAICIRFARNLHAYDIRAQ